ncbi:hypothetical protein PG989_014351 [Apiospora arundinis]
MSIVGSTAFANYDRTAKASGAPLTSTTSHDGMAATTEPTEEVATSDATKTNATSVTDGEKKVTDSGDSEEVELHRRESLVQGLARRFTSQSNVAGAHGHNPFLDVAEDSPLNPASSNFKARTWAKAIVDMDKAGFRSAGVCFQNLNVHGFGAATDYQKDVANVWLEVVGMARKAAGLAKPRKIDILRDFDGVVRKGEMLVVLGPPGSGCSTFLKTIAGETDGIYVSEDAYFNYQGVPAKEMHTHHRGEAIYTAEVDVHFPMLTVGDTLTFAARARAPRELPPQE